MLAYRIEGIIDVYKRQEELKAFVDQCHQAGIGVILDFVPVHFACLLYTSL